MMQEGERTAPGAWAGQAEAVLAGMVDWQTAHPTATLAEIEAEVEARLAEVRARLMERALIRAAEAAADAPPGPCPGCGGVLRGRGQHVRTIRLRGDRQVQARRPYQTCAACGHGLFPPG
jgi:hypothetical protein